MFTLTPIGNNLCRRVHLWRGGRVVECTTFEKWQGRKLFGSSNLPLSALDNRLVTSCNAVVEF